MRMNAVSSSHSALSWLLASVCLRYDVDMPSVCPRQRGRKHPQFSGFRSDSPLTFTSFWYRSDDVGEASRFWYRSDDVGEASRLWWFVVMQSDGCSTSCWTLQSLRTGRCSSGCFFCHFRCLVLGWKSCANQFTVGGPRYSGVCHSDMPASGVVRIDVAISNDSNVASCSCARPDSMA
jgi:hypothetical protein